MILGILIRITWLKPRESLHIQLRITSSPMCHHLRLYWSIWCFEKDVRREEDQLEDDFEEPVKECEDTKLIYHVVLLHKGFSNQGTTWSSWRECAKRRDCYCHLEWPPNIMGFIHSRNMCTKEVDLFQQNMGRMHIRRSSTHNKRREDGSNRISSSHISHQKKEGEPPSQQEEGPSS